jgi:hypothetical protein
MFSSTEIILVQHYLRSRKHRVLATAPFREHHILSPSYQTLLIVEDQRGEIGICTPT